MALSVSVGKISGAFVPVEAEVDMGFTAVVPLGSHQNHLDASVDNGIIYKASGGGVVCLDRQARLAPTHFLSGALGGVPFLTQ